eukprot:5448130-Alexandrium_andersonii.AAC.1
MNGTNGALSRLQCNPFRLSGPFNDCELRVTLLSDGDWPPHPTLHPPTHTCPSPPLPIKHGRHCGRSVLSTPRRNPRLPA